MNLRVQANIPGQGYAEVEIDGANLASVRALGPTNPEAPFISPGFIDIQLNGFAGVNFSDPHLDAASAISVLPSVWETGVTTFCPTLITNSRAGLLRNFAVLEEARKKDAHFAWAVPCYHLEGPYLSPLNARGTHSLELIRNPDWNEFEELQSAAGGRIAIITLAPELPGAMDFIRRAHAQGVIVAIGHTDANPEQIHLAAEAGATLNTHLGNGCPEYIHRHRAPLWAQLSLDSLKATIICDGFHLPPEMVKAIVRVKGIERTILLTDAVHVANLDPGRYSLVGTEIELLDTGQVVTLDRRCMAGSALTMNRAVATFSRDAEVSLPDAIRAATTNPSHVLQRPGTCSTIAEGQPANLVTFRCGAEVLEVEVVISAGETVYAAGVRKMVETL
jgi:N-acetylglucosamine-6-phosphate deacetylase